MTETYRKCWDRLSEILLKNSTRFPSQFGTRSMYRLIMYNNSIYIYKCVYIVFVLFKYLNSNILINVPKINNTNCLYFEEEVLLEKYM